jgi:glycosyltransferase involved in cell wall biosynthesis
LSGSLPEGLRVALVHDWLTVPAGSEEVFAEICKLFPGTVYASQIDVKRCKFLEGMDVRPSVVQKMPLALKKHYLYAPILPYVYARMNLREYDLVLSDSHSFAHGVRKRPDALHVNYYHTPARSLWVPEIDGRASKTAAHRAVAQHLRRLDLVASRRPDILLANSETTASRIEKFYGRKVDRVIYPPIHTKNWSAVQRVSEEEGLLYWGRLIDYKRVDLLIEAVRKTGHKLNIVGSGPLDSELRKQAAGLQNVIFHGRLSDENLRDLMGRSRAVVFAAYEDFGIVPVEAMAAGLPVVAFGEGGAAETVLPEFGVQFKEQTVEALVAALEQLEGRSFDPDALKRHAAKFDVERFRTEYRETVLSALDRHRTEKS